MASLLQAQSFHANAFCEIFEIRGGTGCASAPIA
jgi:hypothetical protein